MGNNEVKSLERIAKDAVERYVDHRHHMIKRTLVQLNVELGESANLFIAVGGGGAVLVVVVILLNF